MNPEVPLLATVLRYAGPAMLVAAGADTHAPQRWPGGMGRPGGVRLPRRHRWRGHRRKCVYPPSSTTTTSCLVG